MASDAAKDQAKISSFQDLAAWQHAKELAKSVYAITKAFPEEEVYGLTQQMRRASVSVASNIAEGYGRGSLGDYIRFLQTARGSLCELETQLMIACELGYGRPNGAATVRGQVKETARVLQGLLNSLQRKKRDG